MGLPRESHVTTRGATGATFGRKWPKEGDFVIVPYTFNANVAESKREKVRQAILRYNEVTCIRIRPRRGERDYIEIKDGTGCMSDLGRSGGKQSMTLGRGCDSMRGIIIHEFMHALGFFHEQSRFDRDRYVTVVWNNIKSGANVNFNKMGRETWDSYGSDYDPDSVMHYGGNFFSKNGRPTIINKATGRAVNYQRRDFSRQDLLQLNRKYEC
uniref:Metalloendopeptidase n=3 Tax=Ciona intestinalis TaxID=7719 RepID=F7BBI5_CIOIN